VVRSIDGSPPVFQYGAPLRIACAEDFHCECADAPLREYAANSLALIIFTRQAGWNVKATNPYSDFQRKSNMAIELLTSK